MPVDTMRSFRSTMMRWAVFSPMPFTLLMSFSLLLAMASHSSAGERLESIMRAVLAPTPDTEMSMR